MEIKPALFGDLLARKISHSEGEIRQREYIRQKFDLIWLADLIFECLPSNFPTIVVPLLPVPPEKTGEKELFMQEKYRARE